MSRLPYFIILWAVSIFVNGSVVNAQPSKTASELLKPYDTLSPNDWQNALIKGAKEERELAVYTSMKVDELSRFVNQFTKHYPFLKVKPSRLSGRQVITRVETEYRAGRYSVDVAGGFANISYSLKRGRIDCALLFTAKKVLPWKQS